MPRGQAGAYRRASWCERICFDRPPTKPKAAKEQTKRSVAAKGAWQSARLSRSSFHSSLTSTSTQQGISRKLRSRYQGASLFWLDRICVKRSRGLATGEHVSHFWFRSRRLGEGIATRALGGPPWEQNRLTANRWKPVSLDSTSLRPTKRRISRRTTSRRARWKKWRRVASIR